MGKTDCGSLEPGLQADMQWVDVPAWAEGPEDVLAWSIFFADAPPPRMTWVAGEVVWDRTRWAAGGGVYPWEGPTR